MTNCGCNCECECCKNNWKNDPEQWALCKKLMKTGYEEEIRDGKTYFRSGMTDYCWFNKTPEYFDPRLLE